MWGKDGAWTAPPFLTWERVLGTLAMGAPSDDRYAAGMLCFFFGLDVNGDDGILDIRA